MIAVFLPIIVGATVILAFLPSENKETVVSISLVFFGIGLLVVTFFPAFPLAQAVSTTAISPISIWRATKGHRWSLILITFATSSINKIVPATSKATNIGEAYLFAASNGLVGMFTGVLATCLGVTAWRYVVRNDRMLTGDVPQAAAS